MDVYQRHIFWSPYNAVGLEHLALAIDDTAIAADALIIGANDDGAPFRLHYALTCDAAWQVRGVSLQLTLPAPRTLQFTADGAGHWRDSNGVAIPALDGCVDVDISATPFTNTLPIRRLALQPGESAEIRVVYFDVPAMTFVPQRQRYTRLAPDRYRYEGLDTDYTNKITVDEHGIVTDYPDLFRRITE